MTSTAAPDASDALEFELKDLLELERLDTNLFRSSVNQPNHVNALFGGQMLGQGLKAAALTMEDRKPHSLHAYFLLAGARDTPVIYDVEPTRDGGSFSTRRVVARQRGRTIFSMEVSFQRDEAGYEHDIALEGDVPDPEQVKSIGELAKEFVEVMPPNAARALSRSRLVEIRPINPENFFLRKAPSSAGRYWMKAGEGLAADALTHFAALAYLSDYFLTTTTMLQHADSLWAGKVMSASLDHALWFHRPTRVDDWLLVDAVSPFAGGARGFTRGQIFDKQRRLVASVAQEALIRPLAPLK
ncbi:MAG: acyl-CoA thioesterase II [Candidatus Obscuribacterales bacterium]|nr:acyl-CoA thioesterase II [Steroidobacteraceae bacterium]